jgi:very-short-patch-repair endonuclease
MMRKIINHPNRKEYRRRLRNNLTPAEATLWLALKNKQLAGRRFKRQVSINHYIVDFYCPSEKLVIELDGENQYQE